MYRILEEPEFVDGYEEIRRFRNWYIPEEFYINPRDETPFSVGRKPGFQDSTLSSLYTNKPFTDAEIILDKNGTGSVFVEVLPGKSVLLNTRDAIKMWKNEEYRREGSRIFSKKEFVFASKRNKGPSENLVLVTVDSAAYKEVHKNTQIKNNPLEFYDLMPGWVYLNPAGDYWLYLGLAMTASLKPNKEIPAEIVFPSAITKAREIVSVNKLIKTNGKIYNYKIRAKRAPKNFHFTPQYHDAATVWIEISNMIETSERRRLDIVEQWVKIHAEKPYPDYPHKLNITTGKYDLVPYAKFMEVDILSWVSKIKRDTLRDFLDLYSEIKDFENNSGRPERFIPSYDFYKIVEKLSPYINLVPYGVFPEVEEDLKEILGDGLK